MPARQKDDGLALIVALAVVMLVFLLITAVLAQAFYDLSEATSSRRRLEAINAAEAGLAWYGQLLNQATVVQLVDLPWVSIGPGRFRLESGSGAPGLASTDKSNDSGVATFSVEVTYFMENPCELEVSGGANVSCSVDVGRRRTNWPTDLADPFWAIVRSTGESGGMHRTLESAMYLTPVAQGGGTSQGLYMGCVQFQGVPNVTIGGDVFIAGHGSGACSGVGQGLLMTDNSMWVQTGTARLNVIGALKTYVVDSPSGKFSAKEVRTTLSIRLGQNASGNGGTCPNANVLPAFCSTSITQSGSGIGSVVATRKGNATGVGPGGPPSWQAQTPASSFDPADWGAEFTYVPLLPPASLDVVQPTIFQPNGCMGALSSSYVIQVGIVIVSQCGFTLDGATFEGSAPGKLWLYVIPPGGTCSSMSSTLIRGVSAPTLPIFISTPCEIRFDGSASQSNLALGLAAERVVFVGPVAALGSQIAISQASFPMPGVVDQFYRDVFYVREIPTP